MVPSDIITAGRFSDVMFVTVGTFTLNACSQQNPNICSWRMTFLSGARGCGFDPCRISASRCRANVPFCIWASDSAAGLVCRALIGGRDDRGRGSQITAASLALRMRRTSGAALPGERSSDSGEVLAGRRCCCHGLPGWISAGRLPRSEQIDDRFSR